MSLSSPGSCYTLYLYPLLPYLAPTSSHPTTFFHQVSSQRFLAPRDIQANSIPTLIAWAPFVSFYNKLLYKNNYFFKKPPKGCRIRERFELPASYNLVCVRPGRWCLWARLTCRCAARRCCPRGHRSCSRCGSAQTASTRRRPSRRIDAGGQYEKKRLQLVKIYMAQLDLVQLRSLEYTLYFFTR